MSTNDPVNTAPSPIPLPSERRCSCCSWKLAIALVAIWIVAIGIAFKFDARISNSLERFTTGPHQISIGVLSKYDRLPRILCSPGTAPFTAAIVILLFFFHPWKWRAAAMLVAGSAIGGIIYQVTKWTVGRERPEAHKPYVFNHFTGGLNGFIHAEKLSFPSGHAMQAFVTATILSICIPRWRVLFFVLACVVAAERVLEHSHYLSDVIAGSGIGVISALIAAKLLWPRREVPLVQTTLSNDQ